MITTATRIQRLATDHLGRITARNDAGTQVRIEFPISTRAAGAYDEAISRNLTANFQDEAMCVLVVTA